MVIGDLSPGEAFPFGLVNAANVADDSPPVCLAALICTADCPYCRERSQREDAGMNQWIMLGGGVDAAQSFVERTGVALGAIWILKPYADGSTDVRLTSMSATPTAVVIRDGVLTELHHAPDPVPVGQKLAAHCP